MIWILRAIDRVFTGLIIALILLVGLYLYALQRAGVMLGTGR